MSEGLFDQVPLLAVPEPYRRKVRKETDATKVTWSRPGGKRHTCGLCTLDIRDGLTDRPLATATHVAAQGERRWWLCSSHAYEVKRGSRKLPS